MTQTEFEHFKTGFDAGKSQLLWRWIVADVETPVSAYLKLCHDQDYALLLESVEGGTTLGRYSAIAMMPDLLWRYDGTHVALSVNGDDWETAPQATPLEHLKAQVKASHIQNMPDDLPPMAASGLFGYLGYDMIRLAEKIPDKNPDTIGIPQGLLMRPQIIVIFDNVRHMTLISTPVLDHAANSQESAQQIYAAAQARLDMAEQRLSAPHTPEAPLQTQLSTPLDVDANISREEYHQAVTRAVEYIRAGDIFQVVPSQRFQIPFDLPSFELYRTLRRINPSPFLFHLKMGDFALIGSSPEILVRVRDRKVTIRPIAGTRKRGVTPDEDQALAEDLLADPKERAEHLMLLDLGRNDVGKVASTGSVKVTERFVIERYSHVMHIVSNVEGDLKPDMDPLDALFSGFPAGTVSGAPKIRAMEIIDELESEKRSFYAGCIGYLAGHGDIDTCIALRTALLKDGVLYVQAGAGVVVDSDPEFEYQECRNKAKAIIHAAELTVERARSLAQKTLPPQISTAKAAHGSKR